jgi:hypothetical protein
MYDKQLIAMMIVSLFSAAFTEVKPVFAAYCDRAQFTGGKTGPMFLLDHPMMQDVGCSPTGKQPMPGFAA